MKGLALESIAYFVLALVSILMIIGLVTGKLGPAAKSAYCKFLKGVRSVLPLPSHLKSGLPAYCTQGSTGIQSKPIIARDPAEISREISAYAVACWEITGKVNVGKDTICYELDIRDIQGELTERNVLDVLLENGYSDFPLEWGAGTIDSPKVLSVSYNAGEKKVVVQ